MHPENRTYYWLIFFIVVMMATLDFGTACLGYSCGTYRGVKFGNCCSGHICTRKDDNAPGVCRDWGDSTCKREGGSCGHHGQSGFSYGTCCNGLRCQKFRFPHGTCIKDGCVGLGQICGSYTSVSWGNCCGKYTCKLIGYSPGKSYRCVKGTGYSNNLN